MDIHRFRRELRHLTAKELLEMALSQKEKGCVLGGLCQYKIVYEGAGFCVLELLGKRCEMEYLRKLLADEDTQSKPKSSDEPLPPAIGLWLPNLW
jgi:hypothetical protein